MYLFIYLFIVVVQVQLPLFSPSSLPTTPIKGGPFIIATEITSVYRKENQKL